MKDIGKYWLILPSTSILSFFIKAVVYKGSRFFTGNNINNQQPTTNHNKIGPERLSEAKILELQPWAIWYAT